MTDRSNTEFAIIVCAVIATLAIAAGVIIFLNFK